MTADQNVPAAVAPEDEFVHIDFPRPLEKSWKENYYFNYVDRKNHAWGVFHVSLMRLEKKARFRTHHVIDGEPWQHIELIDIDDDFGELVSSKMRIEFVEPLREMRVVFKDEALALDLRYTGRFDPYDYASHRKRREATGKHSGLNIRHYEQGLRVRGTLSKNGETRPVDCYGHRDHSWGYRSETNIEGGWNWISVQLPGATVNASQVRLGERVMDAGFVSTAEGNVRIRKLEISDTQYSSKGEPTGSKYVATDVTGRIWTLRSKGFSHIVILINPEDPDCPTMAFDNYSEITLEETGEIGLGVDEYMIHGLGRQ